LQASRLTGANQIYRSRFESTKSCDFATKMFDQDIAATEPFGARSRRQQPVAAQIRAARGMLNWTQAELAARAGLHVRTIERAERGEGMPRITVRTLEAITRALEAGGIEFLQHQGLGVRLRQRR
jgi:DNA-binding XRE family transcriptional regulator